MPGILLITILVLISYFLPYFHLRRWKVLSSIEAAALSVAASSVLFGAVAFATHAAEINQQVVHVTVLVLLAFSILPSLARSFVQVPETEGWLALFFLLFLLLMLLLQSVFPIYIGGFWYFDWWQHYNLSQMYVGKVSHDTLWLGMYNFASRTPLMNLNAAFFLSIFGDSYWLFQVVASILNSVFIFPALLICNRLAGRRKTIMIGALLFVSPSLVHNTWYPWPKLFAAYFVLLAAYFYIRDRREDHLPDTAMCIVVFGLIWAGFLAHQSSLFSSIVILIDLFIRLLRKEPRRVLPLGIICVLCFIIIDGVWFAWATSFFGIKGSFLSYYERDASVGGMSGYLILFTYHTLATICSPLFVYDLFGNRFEALRFFENIQVLYYNSFVGLGTITVFAASIVLLVKRLVAGQEGPMYTQYARSYAVKYLFVLAGLWSLAIAAAIFILPGFGDALFARFFHHPQFARKMFGALFFAASLALVSTASFLLLSARKEPVAIRDSSANLLFWMTIAGFAGGISTHHELYIHGMISAGCATSALLTIMLLARICSDLPRTVRLLMAIPIFFESFLITWFPLLIIKFGWGWTAENNWQLKEENVLVFMADILPKAWWILALGGITIQVGMLLIWGLQGEEQQGERDPARTT